MSIRLRSACIVAVVAASFACNEQAPREPAVIASELTTALQREPHAAAIIALREPRLSPPAERELLVDEISDAVVANLGTTLQLSQRYAGAAALSGRITPQALELLREDPNVLYVQPVSPIRGLLREAVPAVGADRVRRSFGLTGQGVRVAVLDSGMALDHPDLQGAIVGQRCFTQGACGPFNTAQGTDASDGHGHGTAVAGVIASRGVHGPPGFAPQAELVALKVMDSQNRGNDEDLVTALEWLYQHLTELKVDIVNMSLGTDATFSDATECDLRSPPLSRAIRNLRDAGVIVVSATGNGGSTTALTAPGCFSGVLAVGATYDADVGPAPPSRDSFATAIDASFAACRDETTQAGQIACYTNTPPRADVLAPGGPMLTLGLDGGTTTRWGTSFASAAVSGMAAMLRQCNPQLKPDDFASALERSGEQRTDPRTGRSFPFIRLPEATKLACPDLVEDAGMPPPAPAQPTADSGAAGAPPAPAADAGTSNTAPAAKPDLKERDSTALQGAYVGRAPAEPLATRPVHTGLGKDRTIARPRQPAARSGGPRVESASSCAVQPGLSSDAFGWVYALGWVYVTLFASRRRRPRC
jgi:subtilisin family serine protease